MDRIMIFWICSQYELEGTLIERYLLQLWNNNCIGDSRGGFILGIYPEIQMIMATTGESPFWFFAAPPEINSGAMHGTMLFYKCKARHSSIKYSIKSNLFQDKRRRERRRSDAIWQVFRSSGNCMVNMLNWAGLWQWQGFDWAEDRF